MKQTLAMKTLCAAAIQAGAVYANVLKAFTLRSKEKDAFGAVKTPLEKRGLLVSWANATLDGAKIEKSSLNDYIQKCASIVVAPAGLVAKVPDSSAENAPTHDVTPATVTTRRELTALAEAANKAIGRKAKGKKRAATQPNAPTPPSADALELNGRHLHEAIKTALALSAEGKFHANRAFVLSALAECGFKLAPVEMTAPKAKKDPIEKTADKPASKSALAKLAASKLRNPAPHAANARV